MLDPQLLLTKAGVHEGGVVADLGCGGAGHFVFPASTIVGSKGKVFAVDIMEGVLKKIAARAREENRINMHTVWSDLEVVGAAKDIADRSLDVALLINTLFQSKNKKEAMMREAVRMVKRDGAVLVVEWKMTDAPFGPSRDLRVPEEFVRSTAHALSLQEVEAFDAGPYHYGILFKKT